MKVCKRCDKEVKHKGFFCRSCYVNQRKQRVKQMAVEYLGGKCIRCGYNRCVYALDCHHKDKTTKSFNISGAHSRSWKAIKEELDKCVLLCANCHREVEYAPVA